MSQTREGLERLVRLGGWGERSMSGLDLRLWPTYRTFTLGRCMRRVGAGDGQGQQGKHQTNRPNMAIGILVGNGAIAVNPLLKVVWKKYEKQANIVHDL